MRKPELEPPSLQRMEGHLQTSMEVCVDNNNKRWLPNERYVIKPGGNLNRVNIDILTTWCGQDDGSPRVPVTRIHYWSSSDSGMNNCFWIVREERYVISVCCMKNEVGNVVYDAEGIDDIWRNYIEKLLYIENDWHGDMDCPEVIGPCCLISEDVEAAIIWKKRKFGLSYRWSEWDNEGIWWFWYKVADWSD